MTKVFLTSTYLVEENVLPEFSSQISHLSGKNYCRELGNLWGLWRIAAKGKDHLLVQSSSLDVDISNIHSPRYHVAKIENHVSQYSLNTSSFFHVL